ncbi:MULTISPECIES: hypothetical protein [unclassified Dyella]|jgi:hypothetical protein|uniref:hypothetical protein n=1 Tax=unclassified Dyella TaxID=2634549 RepID=UPI003F8E980E
MDSATLTFSALNERIDALPDHESLAIAPTRRQRWGFILGFSAGFIGLIAGKAMPDSTWTVVFTATMLTIEVVALAVALIPRRPWRIPGFAKERRQFAEQLDFDQHHYDRLVAWIRAFPRARIEAMGEYASRRHELLKDKYPLLSGGLEKLGALPVVAALYLQFKDLHWPPHPTWPELILGFALVSLYWASLLVASVRFRAQLFVTLLTRAMESADDLNQESASATSVLS